MGLPDGTTKLGVAVKRRLRLSAWVDPTTFMNGTRTATGGLIPNMKNLFDSSAYKKSTLSGKPTGFRVIDDISLLITVRDNNNLSKLAVGWDTRLLGPGAAGDAARKKFYNDVITHCHDVLGVQCLLGFEQARLDTNPALAQWLKQTTPNPSVDAFTDSLVAFCEDNMPGYDGISFDLEGLSGNATEFAAAKANVAALYQLTAAKIASPPRKPNPRGRDVGYDRLVAFASGNLIGFAPPPATATNPSPKPDGKMKSSRLLKHDKKDDDFSQPLTVTASGDFVTRKAEPLNAGFFERVQDYSLGNGVPNLIIRPMSYDNFKKGDVAGVLDDWHADIVRFMKAHPTATFQLGVKTINGPGQTVLGMDGVMQGVAHVRRRCRDLLNPKDIGLCFFPQSPQFWKDANEELNPTVPEAGRLKGHPLQCPLNDAALAVLNKVPKPKP